MSSGSALMIPNSAPKYLFQSSDVTSGCVNKGSYKGAFAYQSDTGDWYVVLESLLLQQMAFNVIAPHPTVDSNFNGRVWVSTSAVTLSGQNVTNLNGFLLKANTVNTGSIIVFYDGGTSGCGFPLKPGEQISYSGSNLSSLDFAIVGLATTGCICWIKQ
jgi:hypothetical protein